MTQIGRDRANEWRSDRTDAASWRECLRGSSELLIDKIRPRAITRWRTGLVDDEIGGIRRNQRINSDPCSQAGQLRSCRCNGSGVRRGAVSEQWKLADSSAERCLRRYSGYTVDIHCIGGAIIENFERRPTRIGRCHPGARERSVDLRDHRGHAA